MVLKPPLVCDSAEPLFYSYNITPLRFSLSQESSIEKTNWERRWEKDKTS